MSKEYTHIKANGIRNELKEIRKSVDKLTAVMVDIADAIDVAATQTNKHYENHSYNANPSDILSGM